MRKLVVQNFRYASGQIAASQPIDVYFRGTSTRASLYIASSGVLTHPNPMTTDVVGNLSFYIDEGEYDFGVFGIRVPFDVVPSSGTIERYVHTQATPAATWTVQHGLGTKPDLQLFLSGAPEEEVFTSVSYPDLNTVVVEWPSPESGWAYVR